MGTKNFFNDYCGEKVLKPCTQTGVCGASTCCLGTYVPGSGLLQAPHCLFLFPFSVAGCSFSPSTSSEQRTTSRTTAIFPSQSPFLLKLFSGLPTICRGVWFSSLLGSVPAFAPVELAFTFFPSSRAMMGLELGLYAHIHGNRCEYTEDGGRGTKTSEQPERSQFFHVPGPD